MKAAAAEELGGADQRGQRHGRLEPDLGEETGRAVQPAAAEPAEQLPRPVGREEKPGYEAHSGQASGVSAS
jgi:hypothetical protein